MSSIPLMFDVVGISFEYVNNGVYLSGGYGPYRHVKYLPLNIHESYVCDVDLYALDISAKVYNIVRYIFFDQSTLKIIQEDKPRWIYLLPLRFLMLNISEMGNMRIQYVHKCTL